MNTIITLTTAAHSGRRSAVRGPEQSRSGPSSSRRRPARGWRRGRAELFVGRPGRLALCLLLTLAALLAVGQAQAFQPNIVLIVADDLGYDDVGFNGGTEIRTPRIDALARQGTVFTAGYVTASVCSPSRAAILTGRYQHRFGHENNPPAGSVVGLPLDEMTIADVLKSAGYATAIIGKWHLGGAPQYRPNQRGFDYAYGFYPAASSYMPPVNLQRNGVTVTETRYLTTAFGEEAADFIDRNYSRRFFLYLPFSAPHVPLQAPPEYLARYPGISDPTRRTYAAMVSALDDAVGLVAAALERNGLSDDTLIIFLSDNGGSIANGARNAPLRGGKASMLEGGLRVPFFMRWPGQVPARNRYALPVSALDILPTVSSAAAAPRPRLPLDGVNLLPYLSGWSTPLQRSLFWRSDGGTANEQSAARIGALKLVETCGGTAVYDVARDAGESTDIETPYLVAALREQYALWQRQMISPLWPSDYNACGNRS